MIRRPTISILFPYRRSSDLEAEHVGDQIGGEAFDLDVQLARRAVVVAAGHLDFAFECFERALQLPEILVGLEVRDRKSTRLNSSHVRISYAAVCLKKKLDTK